MQAERNCKLSLLKIALPKRSLSKERTNDNKRIDNLEGLNELQRS